MIKKALPVVAVGMTLVAAYLAIQFNQRNDMLKALKAKGADSSGMTDAQKKIWDKI